MLSIGLDIGGANTKLARCLCHGPWSVGQAGCASPALNHVHLEYFPFWENPRAFSQFLNEILGRDLVGSHRTLVTTTAETADCFASRKEGVCFVLSAVERTDPSALVLMTDGRIAPLRIALSTPLKVAAANWVAPSLLTASALRDSILVDAGSTTTDIIPIKGGQCLVKDATDRGRLANHQLVYTGVLRTNVATLVDHITLAGRKLPVASECYATTADVNLILGLIAQEDYTCPASDGAGRDRAGALRRLCRIVCSDLDETSEREVVEMARQIRDGQLDRVSRSLLRVMKDARLPVETTCVAAGLGWASLAREAARRAGIEEIRPFHDIVRDLGVRLEVDPEAVSLAAPAASLAILGCGEV